MAQKIQVVLVDDIDGGDADETVNFALDGVSYEIDLSTANAAKLRAALEPWTSAGRRTTSSRGRAKRGGDTAKIRAWAKGAGIEVSERGRVSAEVREAYEAAH